MSLRPTWSSAGARLGTSGTRSVRASIVAAPTVQLGEAAQQPACVLLVAGGLRLADELGGHLVVGETQLPARHAQPVGDAGEHVVGDDMAAGEDLGDLGLGLPGQRGDAPLRHPDPLQDPEDAGDIPRREGRPHVAPQPQPGIHPVPLSLPRH